MEEPGHWRTLINLPKGLAGLGPLGQSLWSISDLSFLQCDSPVENIWDMCRPDSLAMFGINSRLYHWCPAGSGTHRRFCADQKRTGWRLTGFAAEFRFTCDFPTNVDFVDQLGRCRFCWIFAFWQFGSVWKLVLWPKYLTQPQAIENRSQAPEFFTLYVWKWFELNRDMHYLLKIIKRLSRHMGMSENGVYSQWNSHLIGIMIINHWV